MYCCSPCLSGGMPTLIRSLWQFTLLHHQPLEAGLDRAWLISAGGATAALRRQFREDGGVGGKLRWPCWVHQAFDRRPLPKCIAAFLQLPGCPAALQYSFSLTTFSPSGKLVQIEYALAAVNAGATSLGIRATDGVVLATEKKLPSILVDESTVQKISLLTPNVGMTYSGMGPDSRVLVRKARKSGQVYYRQYHEQIPVAQLCRETAAVMQEFTRKRGGRGGRAGAVAAHPCLPAISCGERAGPPAPA